MFLSFQPFWLSEEIYNLVLISYLVAGRFAFSGFLVKAQTQVCHQIIQYWKLKLRLKTKGEGNQCNDDKVPTLKRNIENR